MGFNQLRVALGDAGVVSQRQQEARDAARRKALEAAKYRRDLAIQALLKARRQKKASRVLQAEVLSWVSAITTNQK